MKLRMVGMTSATGMFSQLQSRLSGGRSQWVVSTDVEYAIYQELGTRHMAAQPFMRPAAQTVQANVGRHVAAANSLDEAIQSAALHVESEAKRQAPTDTGRLRASITARRT